MRILQSQVALTSSRAATTTDSTRTTIEAWVGNRPSQPALTSIANGPTGRSADAAAQAAAQLGVRRLGPAALASLSAPTRGSGPRAQLPGLGYAAAPAAGPVSAPDSSLDDPTMNDPQLRILALLVEAMTGRKVHVMNPAEVRTDAEAAAQRAGAQAAAAQTAAASSGAQAPAQAQQPAGWGVDVRVQQVHRETETTAYSAAGQIVTADGRTVDFAYQASMHRELVQSSQAEITLGDAIRKVDPIALNLSGGTVALSETRTGFDIDSDGSAESVALPAAGTYFLALDRNGNGRVDTGSELFGPSSGNGFAELRALDGDGNGWIDEGDTIYASLRLWSGGDANGGLQSLAEAGVGALYVGANVATHFDIRNGANETLGQVVSSSVYLSEDGTPGALQQVDLTA